MPPEYIHSPYSLDPWIILTLENKSLGAILLKSKLINSKQTVGWLKLTFLKKKFVPESGFEKERKRERERERDLIQYMMLSSSAG